MSSCGRAACTGVRRLTANRRRKQKNLPGGKKKAVESQRRRILGLFGKGAIRAAPQPKSSVLQA